MTASYQLLISCALLLSIVVLCHGEPVLDTDGHEVELTSPSSYALYRIRNAGIGFHGGLAPLIIKDLGKCKHYVYEAPESNPGTPVFLSASTSQRVAQLGFRYTISFSMPTTEICTTAWSIGGSETHDDISFKPITAGDYFNRNNFGWFEMRSTEETGVYKLAACSSEFDRMSCPEVGTFVVNGTTRLGIGGEHFTIRFQKYVRRLAAAQ